MIKYWNYDIVFQEFPDELTLAINCSLCPNSCPGCHSPHLARDIGEELTISELSSLIASNRGITCVGFMGGDNDPREIQELARFIRNEFGGRLKIGWYSGREKIYDKVDLTNFDYIKVGGYKKEFGPLNSKTTNQRMYKVDRKTLTLEDITYKFWRK